MNDIPSYIKINRVLGLLCIMLLTGLSAVAANDAFTNKDVDEILGKSNNFKNAHDLMVQQRERIDAILNALLIGDTETIHKESKKLLQVMNKINQTLPLTPENESIAWQSMSTIVKEANLLQQEASKNDFTKAHTHFSNITASCIRCHQSVR